MVLYSRYQKFNTFLDLDDGLAKTRLQVVIPTEKLPEQGAVFFAYKKLVTSLA